MDYTYMTAIEVEVLEAVYRHSGRPTVAELVAELAQPVSVIKHALTRLRKAVLVNELPARGAAAAIYGITVFGKAELRRRHELKAAA